MLWTIGYDTIYAHQDNEDDLMLGLKSTALTFGDDTPRWVGGFYAGALVLWIVAGYSPARISSSSSAWRSSALQMAWQVSTLDIHDPEQLPAPLPLQPRRRRRDLPRPRHRHAAVVVGRPELKHGCR